MPGPLGLKGARRRWTLEESAGLWRSATAGEFRRLRGAIAIGCVAGSHAQVSHGQNPAYLHGQPADLSLPADRAARAKFATACFLHHLVRRSRKRAAIHSGSLSFRFLCNPRRKAIDPFKVRGT